MLGVAAAAALAMSAPVPAQDIDNRPIYYVMLKSLEGGFKTYNDELVAALGQRITELRRRYDSDREAITAAFDKLEAERDRRLSAFAAERDALNKRFREIGDQIALRTGRASETQRIDARFANDPQVKTLTDSLAAERARLAALDEEYRADIAAVREAREHLTRQFEEYTSAGDPLALEIRSLEEEWQRFAEGERGKLKKLADAYAEDHAAYNDWLESQRAALGALDAELARAVETDREQRELHARIESELGALIDEYNALVEVHNSAGSDDANRDARAKRFVEMEKSIATLQQDLARARETVIRVDEDFRGRSREYDEHYERFLDEKRSREARLAGDLSEINTARAAVEAEIDARRQKVDTQTRALEAQLSSELEGARRDLEALNRRLVESFGRDHEGLDAAIKQFFESGDDRLLYTEQGAPRFDLSKAKAAEVYRSVEQMLADRGKVDARIVALKGSEGTSDQTAGGSPTSTAALEHERAALAAERQQLLEAHASFSREQQSRTAALEKRSATLDEQHAGARARLEELFSLRADATRSEFQLVQQVLVGAIRGRSRQEVDPAEHAKLVKTLREKSAHADIPQDLRMGAASALLDHIDSGLPPRRKARVQWKSFTLDEVIGSRTLGGDEKAMVAFAWLARYRRQPDFAATARALDETGAVANGDEALATLFLDGVLNHMSIDEQRLASGGVGIRVGVLGRDYQVEANGSLEPLPEG